LPDKAIDLIDECASKLRIEIDSMPREIDEVQRKITQAEIERQALKKENDSASTERLGRIESALETLRAQLVEMKSHWDKERQVIQQIQSAKEQLERIGIEEQKAERQGDLAKVAELRYGRTTELQHQVEQAKQELEDLQSKRKMLKEEVDAEDIAEVVSQWTGIPVTKMMEGEREKLVHMEKRLAQRVVGQQRAIKAVSDAVRRARSGLQDPERPIGSFIFMGPTGVGKTELAKALAEFIFDDEHAMVRIDMSEYMEKHAVARLIGAPPGYVGYDEGGYLTNAVRRRPYTVVLFDEIEKAHPEVFNVLLQILDDGRMTDGHGKTVDFTNTIVIMTSNVGSQFIQNYGGDQREEMEQRVMETLRAQFKPEFLNRIDETIIFLNLSPDQIGAIVGIQMAQLAKRLATRKIFLTLGESARELLVQRGYDPTYGARPLKRAIQQYIENPLAMDILKGAISENTRLQAEADGDQMVFKILEN
jgi:ATP-dependent Clp protease ATP-binding subunit ClpB